MAVFATLAFMVRDRRHLRDVAQDLSSRGHNDAIERMDGLHHARVNRLAGVFGGQRFGERQPHGSAFVDHQVDCFHFA